MELSNGLRVWVWAGSGRRLGEVLGDVEGDPARVRVRLASGAVRTPLREAVTVCCLDELARLVREAAARLRAEPRV